MQRITPSYNSAEVAAGWGCLDGNAMEQAAGDACLWYKGSRQRRMKGGAVVSVWHMVIIAGANTHDHDVFSMKDSLLVFQAFIFCEWLLGRNLLNEYYVSPTLAAGLKKSGATQDSAIFIIPPECVSMTEGDLSFSPTAFIISHLLKMHQTFAFGNPPLLSQLLYFLLRFYQRVAFDIRPWAEMKKRHIILSGLFPVTHLRHTCLSAPMTLASASQISWNV